MLAVRFGSLLIVILTTGFLVRGAAPPVSPEAIKRDLQRAKQLEDEANQHALAGRFADALRASRKALRLRSRWLPPKHHLVQDSKQDVENLARLTDLPAEKQEQLGNALRFNFRAARLVRQAMYEDAQRLCQKALTIRRKVLGEEHPDTATSYNNVASCLSRQGQHGKALPLYEKALAIYRKVLGEEHPKTAAGYGNVASCLNSQGRQSKALPLHERALDIYRKVLGEEHPDTALSYNNLAGCLKDQGQYARALLLFEKALNIYRKVLGEDHPDTARTYANVAGCLNAQGQYARALPLYEKALAIHREALGEEHQHAALSYNNVAACLNDQGQHRKALALHQKALAIRRNALGERHPDTAQSYYNVAYCLSAQRLQDEALPLYEKALAIYRKVLGEEHPHTAQGYNGVASCLAALGQRGKALPLFEKALAIRRKVLGEEHPETAGSYNNLASCLNAEGQYDRALPLLEKALAIHRKVLGEEHRDTASCYANLAECLNAQGQHGNALPLFEKALAIRRKALGEEHPHTTLSYNNLAACLQDQGQHGKALALHQKALDIRRRVLGLDHSETATSYDSVAACLHFLGQRGKALPLFEKALAIRRKVLGEDHPETAASYNNLAFCLNAEGQHGRALPLLDEALRICRKALGEEHLRTASSYSNVATCLQSQGQHGKALPLYQKALHVDRKVLGEEHPRTATSYNNVAGSLWYLGRVAEATRLLQRSLPGQEVARFHKADSGFDRALASRDGLSPELLLALGLARLRQPRNAFAHADAGLARALLDDLLRSDTDVTSLADRLAKLDEQLLPLFGRDGLSKAQARLREELILQRREFSAELVRRTAAASARQLLPLADIQEQIPQEAALVFWIDSPVFGEFQACIVRHRGAPEWVRLTGGGEEGKWTEEEWNLHVRLNRLLRDPLADNTVERQNAIARLRKLRLEPLLAHLRGSGGLPAVRHLLVVPADWAASIPLEVLAPEYRISYVPSGSAFAHMRRQARPLSGTSLLALGDPAFARKPVRRPETLIVERGPDPTPLPGARREVAALSELIPKATTWVGSDASEQRLDELIVQGKLRDYRLIHVATHGQVNAGRPELSSVLLARDDLPDPPSQAERGRKVYTGELTVDTIRREWRELRIVDGNRREWRNVLDADLVVLSACVTGLGTESHGDGMLGFAQAFLSRGARCVVLSRWHVNDDATALLMQRFYQNLLGKRPGLKKALGRAAALEEARNWLRNLSAKEAGAAVASLPRGTVAPLPGAGKAPPVRPVPPGEKPYAHPFYWSPFVLIGDPD
jgi:tetratricopeptide (TPR) repeat protein/CHAT domain-containing protein